MIPAVDQMDGIPVASGRVTVAHIFRLGKHPDAARRRSRASRAVARIERAAAPRQDLA